MAFWKDHPLVCGRRDAMVNGRRWKIAVVLEARPLLFVFPMVEVEVE